MSKAGKAKGHTTGEIDQLRRMIKDLQAQLSSYKQLTEQLQPEITDHKKAEKALADANNLRTTLTESLPYPSMLIRKDRTVIFANRVAREVGAVVGGQCWRDFGHSDYIPDQDKVYINQHQEKPPGGTHCTFCLADDALNDLKTAIVPEVHAFGGIWEAYWIPVSEDVFLHYALDITERKQAEETLQLERDRLSNILDTMEDGVYIVNQQCNIQYINPVIKREFGPVNNRKCYEYFHDRTEPCPWCKNAEVFAGKSVHWEWFSFKNNKHYDLFDTPFLNQDGSISKFEIFRDITERKLAEEALRGSEQQHRFFVEKMNEGFAVQKDQLLTYVNEAFCRMLGYSRDELIGEEITTFLDEENREKLKDQMTNRGESAVESYEITLTAKDGSQIHTILSPQSLYYEGGIFRGSSAVFTDITKRKRAEEALRKEKVFAEGIVQTAQAIVLVLDPKGRIIGFNPYMEKISGYQFEEVRDKDWFDTFLPKQDRQHIRELFSKAVSDIHTQGNINPIVTKDGELRQIEWYDKTLRDAYGKLIGVLAIGQDITERKKAEEQAKSSLKEKELLLKEVHHRTKNNFQVISSMLYLQSEYANDKKASGIFDKCQDRIKSMASVHEQLYKSGDLARVDFAEYTRNLLISLYRSFGISKKSIKFQINIDNIFLGLDLAIPCGLIINELFSNSLKHAFPELKKGDNRNAQICIDMHETDNHEFILVVSDNGIGLTSDINSMNGQSLGLYLVKNLIQQIDGTIELDTDKGTKYTIKFPCNAG